MSDRATAVMAAEARVSAAKQRLSLTSEQWQSHLQPRMIARRAADDVAEAGNKVAEAAASHAPAIGGAILAIGLFLARHKVRALLTPRPKPPRWDHPAPPSSRTRTS